MIVEVSGRPLVALQGAVPAYRDLVPGDTGADVAQLQRGLAAIGYPAGGDTAGTFGAGTAAAVAAFYTALGYTLPDGEPMVPRAEIMFVPRFPARVIKVAGPVGKQAPGSLATLSMGRPGVAAQLSPTDGALIKAGMAVTVTDPATGLARRGRIVSVALRTTAAHSRSGGVYLPAAIRTARPHLGVIVPEKTALQVWGLPHHDSPAQMIIHTRLGAAPVVAGQVPVALRPDDPLALTAATTASGSGLGQEVASSLNNLLLALAGIALIVGLAGIANTTLVAVLERKSEIGLRRALGARPVHISAQFLTESTALGLAGGLIGASLGVVTVLVVTVLHHWTAVLAPGLVLAAPAAGAIIGLLAGLYPALRASGVESAEALR